MKQFLGPIYLSLAASIWGGVYVVSKVALEYLPALELIWFRYMLALFTMVALGLVKGVSWKISKKTWFYVVCVGFIGYFISIWAQFAYYLKSL